MAIVEKGRLGVKDGLGEFCTMLDWVDVDSIASFIC